MWVLPDAWAAELAKDSEEKAAALTRIRRIEGAIAKIEAISLDGSHDHNAHALRILSHLQFHKLTMYREAAFEKKENSGEFPDNVKDVLREVFSLIDNTYFHAETVIGELPKETSRKDMSLMRYKVLCSQSHTEFDRQVQHCFCSDRARLEWLADAG